MFSSQNRKHTRSQNMRKNSKCLVTVHLLCATVLPQTCYFFNLNGESVIFVSKAWLSASGVCMLIQSFTTFCPYFIPLLILSCAHPQPLFPRLPPPPVPPFQTHRHEHTLIKKANFFNKHPHLPSLRDDFYPCLHPLTPPIPEIWEYFGDKSRIVTNFRLIFTANGMSQTGNFTEKVALG